MLDNRLIVEGYINRSSFDSENILDHYRTALKHHINGIKLDLWMTEDEVPVIINACNATGLVKLWNIVNNKFVAVFIHKVSFDDLNNYRLSDRCTRVISLDEFLKELGEQTEMYIDFEIKQESDRLIEQLLTKVRQHSVQTPLELSSYFGHLKHVIHYWCNALNLPQYPFCVNMGNHSSITDKRFTNDMKISDNNICIDLDLALCYPEETKAFVAELRNMGRNIKCQSSAVLADIENSELYVKLVDIGFDTFVSFMPLKFFQSGPDKFN